MAITQTQVEDIAKRKSFNQNADLTDKEREQLDFFKKRKIELQGTRKDVFGINLEEIWKDADKDYVPHTLKSPGKKVIYTDEDKGWRGNSTILNKSDDWQYDGSLPNPFIKIQSAISILLDRNPKGIFNPAGKKFDKTTALIKALYEKNWEITKSKQQLKLFIFNLCKYGWAIARTYPSKEKNDVVRENMDPWNCWIDDMARPNNEDSIRDWTWRKVYPWDIAERDFGDLPNWKFVKPGGNIQDKTDKGQEKKHQEKDLVEVYFYENRIKDLFLIVANDVPIMIDVLPIGKENKKRLSCWQTYYTLRHAESPYGVGIYEAIKNDQTGLDRIRNMTIDQLTLSIYKMFFYTGTTALSEEGVIKIRPGVGKQVMDAKNISWLEIPGPGNESWEGIGMFQKAIDDESGITPALEGEITGKTAFEIAQAKESALKRMKTPLDNICDALEQDGYLTIDLIQLVYSVPEVITVSDPKLIEEYLNEIQGDPTLYERTATGEFVAKVYREVQLGLEQNKEGNLVETKDTQFFRLKPDSLEWEGIINIDPQSILTPSEELSKALDLEMLNVLSPLMQNVQIEIATSSAPKVDPTTGMQTPGNPITLDDTTFGKTIKQILKLYKKEPEDWLADSWLQEGTKPAEQPLMVPIHQVMGQQPQGQTVGQQVSGNIPEPGQGKATLPQSPQSLGSRIVSQFANKLTGRK